MLPARTGLREVGKLREQALREAQRLPTWHMLKEYGSGMKRLGQITQFRMFLF
jgi:hypothetical protein